MRTRTIVIGFGVLVTVAAALALVIPQLLEPGSIAGRPYWPTSGWQTGPPEEQGFDSANLVEGLQTIRKRNIPVDSLLLIRDGTVVLDAYFYPYEEAIPHKLASVTKSVMTTLIGIAVDQGRIQLDQPLVPIFPDRAIANLDARKEHVTVRHLVSMRNGFESGCLSGDESTLNAMRANLDWVQAALDREMVTEPGTTFCYDSPGMHLLSAVLQEATGMTALDFARQYLFEPLGIHQACWQSDPQGYTHGWGDLYLHPRDAAKIGYLWLNDGIWEGEQIVSSTWISDSIAAHSRAGEDGYGYGWWVSEDSFYALGRGGQNIRVYPALKAIVVMTANGADYDEVEALLVAAFADPDQPLPSNPEGVAMVHATLESLAQAPEPWPVGAQPALVEVIAGRTYVMEPNPADLAMLRIEFNEPELATVIMQLHGREQVWPVGLDGSFRLAADGQGVRGYWADPMTMVIQVFEDGLATRRVHFVDERVQITFPELGLRFEGWSEKP